MSDLDARLTDELERLAANYRSAVTPDAVIADLRRTSPLTTTHRSRRGRAVLAVAACLVVAMVVVSSVVVLRQLRKDDVVVVPSTTPVTTPLPTVDPPVPSTASTTTAPVPIEVPTGSALVRRGAAPVTAVTDSTYIVWGGEDAITLETDRNDGFTVDLDTGAVTVIDPAPISPSYSNQGAWTGSELVVWSTGDHPAAAAWSLATRSWRPIATPPAEVSTGQQAVGASAAQVMTVTSTGVAAAYDVAADRWEMLPTLPAWASFNQTVLWTGSDFIYWAAKYYGGPYPTPMGAPIADTGWRWSADEHRWLALPDLPDGSRTSVGSIVWTGTELVVWGLATGGGLVEDVGVGAALRLGDERWRSLAPSPQLAGRGWNGTAGSQWLVSDVETGSVLVAPVSLDGDPEQRLLLRYRPLTDDWTTTDVVIGVNNPSFVADRRLLLVPDPTTPILGRVPR